MQQVIQRTAIYVRKSTESEERQILSINSQIDELVDYAARSGLAIQKHSFDTVLCWKLDRLARNPIDGGRVIWALEQQRLSHIHTPQHSYDNTGNDKFWMQLEFGMAKKYVDDLSENVKRGIKARIKQGWQCGKPPRGLEMQYPPNS